ncbi:MAG: SDR family oxidoreductase, partial [Acidobacteriota bacterium]
AVVCGASAGIGRAVANALADEGANLVVCARRKAVLESLAESLAARCGIEAAAVPADLSTLEGCELVLERTKEAFGGADILVTNTGGPPAGGFEDSATEDNLRRGWELTFMSAVRLIRGFLPGMAERKWGRILAVTSTSVFEPVPNLALSNAYRAGLTGMLKTLSSEAAPHGVTVNALCPGFTDTERLEELAEAFGKKTGRSPEQVYEGWLAATPAGRLGRPEELAAAAVFLCSEPAAFITGVSLPVDGGRLHGVLA